MGATQDGQYVVVTCLKCARLFSLWQKGGGRPQPPPACRDCGEPLTPVTSPGAWTPAELQRRFPDYEPWMVTSDLFEDELTAEEDAQLAQIRLHCPKCRAYSLGYKTVVYWD